MSTALVWWNHSMKTVQSPFHFCLVSHIIIILFEIMIESVVVKILIYFISHQLDLLNVRSTFFLLFKAMPLLLFRKRCQELILYVTIDTHAVLLPTMPLSGTLSKSHTQPPFFDHITISEPKSCTQLCLTCSVISRIWNCQNRLASSSFPLTLHLFSH